MRVPNADDVLKEKIYLQDKELLFLSLSEAKKFQQASSKQQKNISVEESFFLKSRHTIF